MTLGGRRLVPGVAALAVALAACTTTAVPDADGGEIEALGLALQLPVGFERVDAGGEPRPRDTEVTWVGPRGADGTSAGITAVRLCEAPLPDWAQLRAEVESGDHTDWSDYRLSEPPVEVEISGAARALRARGTYALPVEGREDEVEVVHDEVLMHADQAVHRLRVEGSRANVDGVPVGDLFDSVRVVSTACPV